MVGTVINLLLVVTIKSSFVCSDLITINSNTVLNIAVTIRHVLKVDAATIQRQPIFKGGVYYT